ncbi:MAG: CHASE2 domain-containing protein, partial [Gammaproteobacteria bacterium]|nr:CHASE2 domain-containing protein [Gammaproteobacteria bacterium]
MNLNYLATTVIRQWKQFLPDLWLGLIVTSAFYLLAYQFASPTFYELETAAYDNAMRLADRPPHPDVKIIAIDDRSIRNIGRWPWTRDILASAIERLHQGGARLIVNTILLSESELDPGYDALKRLRTSITNIEADGKSDADRLAQLKQQLEQELALLDYDGQLLSSLLTASNVVLPYEFTTASGKMSASSSTDSSADHLQSIAIAPSTDQALADSAIVVDELILPLDSFAKAAAGLGFTTVLPDRDGAIRRQVMLVDHAGSWLPSLALGSSMKALGIDAAQVAWQNDRALDLKGTMLPLHNG